MRLADVVLRQGHLSDQALVEVWTTGVRPEHLDRCGQCAGRALEMSRWLEDVQTVGRADADAVFTEDRLERQRESVMDRLAELARPSKVISFPAASLSERQAQPRRRLNAGWLAAAAAAGIMLGVVTVELSHLWSNDGAPATVAATSPALSDAANVDLLDGAFELPSMGALSALDEMTPRLDVVLVSNR
jgi:anti-sigma factor RsiW